MTDENVGRVRARFDGTVTLGNVLTLLTFVVAVVLGYATLDKRIAVLEQLLTIYVPKVDRLEDRK